MHSHTNYHLPILKDKKKGMAQTSFSNYLTLVLSQGQGQINVMSVHCTTSNGHAPTYEIALAYLLKDKIWYGPDKDLHLFDL